MTKDELKKIAHDLLVNHPSRGVTPAALTEVLESLSINEFQNDELICKEGEAGDGMFFLFYGAAKVTRKDAGGEERELVTISAPALFGHMALVDNSPRSATCRASGTTRVAPLDRQLYNTMLSESSPRGTALRRMLLTSLTRQLENATVRLRRLITDGEERKETKDAAGAGSKQTEKELMDISGVLHGWTDDQLKAADEVEVVYTEQQKAEQLRRKQR